MNQIDQKLKELYAKHSCGGTTPRQLMEANIAREFRISKNMVHEFVKGMESIKADMNVNSMETELKLRGVKKKEVKYNVATQEDYQYDLSQSR